MKCTYRIIKQIIIKSKWTRQLQWTSAGQREKEVGGGWMTEHFSEPFLTRNKIKITAVKTSTVDSVKKDKEIKTVFSF